MLSYGVRNSIAAYLSFSEGQPPPPPPPPPAPSKSLGRMNKSKSMYGQLPIANYDGNF